MESSLHLKNAPITEALIDIQFDPVQFDIVSKIDKTEIVDLYPNIQPIKHATVKVDVNADDVTESTSKTIGLRFTSKDSKYISQFRENGFTLSRLPPYERWESIRDEANRLWAIYRGIIGSVKIRRLGVRYINKILLTDDIIDLQKYFTEPPALQPSDKEILKSFLQRFVIENQDTSVTSIIHLANETSDGKSLPVILDINSFLYREYEPDSPQVWNDLEVLRDQKNNIFYRSISKKTVEMFS